MQSLDWPYKTIILKIKESQSFSGLEARVMRFVNLEREGLLPKGCRVCRGRPARACRGRPGLDLLFFAGETPAVLAGKMPATHGGLYRGRQLLQTFPCEVDHLFAVTIGLVCPKFVQQFCQRLFIKLINT